MPPLGVGWYWFMLHQQIKERDFMYAYRVRHTQATDRRVLVTLPPDFPEGAFEILVVSETDTPPCLQMRWQGRRKKT